MSADEHLSEQLRMFVPAGELRAYRPGYADAGLFDGTKEFWDTKLSEAVAGGLAASVAAKGVQEPVNVWHDRLGKALANGGHRVAVAAHLNPESLVPVRHYDESTGTYFHATWDRQTGDGTGRVREEDPGH